MAKRRITKHKTNIKQKFNVLVKTLKENIKFIIILIIIIVVSIPLIRGDRVKMEGEAFDMKGKIEIGE